MISLVFFGTPQFVLPILNALISQSPNTPISCVVTAPDKPVGRRQLLTPTPVKKWAQEHKILALTPEKLDKNFSNLLISPSPNIPISSIFILAAYSKILPSEILSLPQYGCLNIHPSLLPKYRGPSPVQAAILSGNKETGVTIIKMDEKIDHGPIVSQFRESINPEETTETLSARLFQKAAEVLVTILPAWVEGRIIPREQDHPKATSTKILKREDGYINLNHPPPPEIFERMLRAYHPWPGVWTRVGIRNQESGISGKVIKFLPNQKLQVEGGKPMSVRDFLNGYPEAKKWLQKLFPLR